MRLLLFLAISSVAFGHYSVIGKPLEALGISGIRNELRTDEAERQFGLFSGSFEGERAVEVGLGNFLEAYESEESLLSIAIQAGFDQLGEPYIYPPPPEFVQLGQDILKSHLNKPSSEVRFLLPEEKAAQGETVDRAWIILLKVPTLSDKDFWVVVNRKDEKQVYNYGD